MRFGVKAKEALTITLLTLLVVATTTLVHLSQLTRVVVQEALRQAELIEKQIYAQSSRSLSRSPSGNPREILRSDRDLRSLLDASVGYSPHLLYALIADRKGRIILHSEREKEGRGAPERPSLQQLLSLDPARRFQALYQGGTIYEATLPLKLDGKLFGSIKLGIATSLLRRELNASLRQSLALAGLALPVLTALGRLTSGVAHEVKNPLNAMMIHLELLKEKLDTPSEEVEQSLEVIRSEIRRLDRVVQGFLKFIRPRELVLKPVDLPRPESREQNSLSNRLISRSSPRSSRRSF